MKQIRQGDVLLTPVMGIPKDAVEIEGPIILALGEVTGHAHTIRLPESERHKVKYCWTAEGERFLQVLERIEIPLSHEEHGPIIIEPGLGKQGFQVEDFGQEVRRVTD